MKNFLCKFDIVKIACNHLFGANHTEKHRRIVGSVVMIIGVGLAHCSQCIQFAPLQVMGDLTGYAIHSIGLMPFLSKLGH